jgi:hypothetical protein
VHGFKLAAQQLPFEQEPAAEYRYVGASERSSLPSAHAAFQSASVQLHHQCAITIQPFIFHVPAHSDALEPILSLLMFLAVAFQTMFNPSPQFSFIALCG